MIKQNPKSNFHSSANNNDHLKILKSSEYFDANYYLNKYKDVKGFDPYIHYLNFGWKEKRIPSPKFDPIKYSNQKEEIVVTNPVIHYELLGKSSGYITFLTDDEIVRKSKYFDELFYISKYKDIEQSGIDPATHYLLCGYKEGRLPSPKMDPEMFYVDNNLQPREINPVLYYEQNQNIIKLDVRPTEEFFLIKNSIFFDEEYYQQTYPDRKIKDCITDFLVFGNKERKNPSAKFITGMYLDYYEDIKKSEINPLIHYIKFGEISKNNKQNKSNYRIYCNGLYPAFDYLIISCTSMNNGVTYWRANFKKDLLENNKKTAEIEILESPSRYFLSRIFAARSIIIVRGRLDPRILKIKQIAESLNKNVISDYDDLYISTLSKNNGKFLSCQASYNEVFNMYISSESWLAGQHTLIVSTSYLQKIYKKILKIPNITVIPNLIPKRFLNLKDRTHSLNNERHVNIGYASGTITHDYDFSTEILPLINSCLRHTNTRIIILGQSSAGDLLKSIFSDRVTVYPKVDFNDMFKIYSEMDILLVPLANNQFNEGKSAIKFIEAGAVGTPVLALSTEEFRNHIKDGHNGFLYKDTYEFASKLEIILRKDDPCNFLKEVGKQAYQSVCENCTTSIKINEKELQCYI